MSDRLQTQASNGAGVDVDALETSERLEALDAVVAHDGPERARDLLTRVVERAQHVGTGPIASLNTPYVNTIPIDREAPRNALIALGAHGDDWWRRGTAHHGDLRADAAPPSPMATAPQRHTTVAERPLRRSYPREEPRMLGSARGLPELARRRSVSTAKSRSDREAVDNPSSGADLRRTHHCPPDRWTPLTQMPLTRAPRRTRSTRVGSVSSSSRSCRGRRAFRSWSVFTPPPIWGDSSAANPVRGESAPWARRVYFHRRGHGIGSRSC